MADCVNLFLNLDLINAVLCPFTNVIGFWTYVIIVMALEISLFIKLRDVNAVAMFGIFSGLLLLGTMPLEAWRIFISILIFNTAVVLYRLFMRRSD